MFISARAEALCWHDSHSMGFTYKMTRPRAKQKRLKFSHDRSWCECLFMNIHNNCRLKTSLNRYLAKNLHNALRRVQYNLCLEGDFVEKSHLVYSIKIKIASEFERAVNASLVLSLILSRTKAQLTLGNANCQKRFECHYFNCKTFLWQWNNTQYSYQHVNLLRWVEYLNLITTLFS